MVDFFWGGLTSAYYMYNICNRITSCKKSELNRAQQKWNISVVQIHSRASYYSYSCYCCPFIWVNSKAELQLTNKKIMIFFAQALASTAIIARVSSKSCFLSVVVFLNLLFTTQSFIKHAFDQPSSVKCQTQTNHGYTFASKLKTNKLSWAEDSCKKLGQKFNSGSCKLVRTQLNYPKVIALSKSNLKINTKKNIFFPIIV